MLIYRLEHPMQQTLGLWNDPVRHGTEETKKLRSKSIAHERLCFRFSCSKASLSTGHPYC